MRKERYTYTDLLSIMARLRAPDGCPWDREQDHESLKRYLIEETYEVLEAIDQKDPKKLCDELGDLLLQVIFHAQIASENGQFTMDDVYHGVSAKMVNRHRHVFGDEKAENSDDVLKIWEEVKKDEKGHATQTQALMDVPPHLPALMRSYKVQQKAAQVGFDWDDPKDALLKVREETDEVLEAMEKGDALKVEEEIGDLLFAVVNVSRFAKVQPELALGATVKKFIRRFEHVEKRSREMGMELTSMTLAEMDKLWDEAKELERKS